MVSITDRNGEEKIKMTSSTDNLDRKRWREYLKRVIIQFIKITYSFIKWVFHYSGLEFIYRKFNPPKNPQPLPTGFIWVVGIYVAFFGVASQRYENRIDIIENRANSIFAQLAVPSVQKKAIGRISLVQNMQCPYKPNILNPSSVFISLFKDSKYGEMIELLKELEFHDPDYWSIVDTGNTQRIVRALEVIRTTGQTYTSFRINSFTIFYC